MQTVTGSPRGTRPPSSGRSRAWVWVSVLVVVGLIATVAVWSFAGDERTVEPAASTQPVDTAQPVVTTSPAPTTTPELLASKSPMPTIEALIEATYALETPATRIEVRDTEAVYAFRTPGVIHSDYFWVEGNLALKGTYTDTFRYNPPLRSLTRLGPPIVSGMMVAVPVEYEFSFGTNIGFDLFRVEEVEGGYLIAEQATFHARTPIDPDIERFMAEEAAGIVTAYVTAWNEGDEVAARAAFAADGAFWEGWNEPGREVYEGGDLTSFITSRIYIDVAASSEEAIVAGPFLVVPNRLTGIDTSDGMSLFMFEDGKIALQVFHE